MTDMIKKILSLVLCLVFITGALVSCGNGMDDVETLTMYGAQPFLKITADTAPYADALYLFNKYYSDGDYVLYLPREGTFKTASGEEFTVQLGEGCGIYFTEYSTRHSRIFFDVWIYDKDGELILERDNFCSYVTEGRSRIDLSYVTLEFRKYWKAMAISSADITDPSEIWP